MKWLEQLRAKRQEQKRAQCVKEATKRIEDEHPGAFVVPSEWVLGFKPGDYAVINTNSGLPFKAFRLMDCDNLGARE